MKKIYLLLLPLVLLLISPASTYASFLTSYSDIKSIRPDETESPTLDNGFQGTLKITNKNWSSFLYPKHSYINKGKDESSKNQKLYISQKFESDCDFNGSTEAIYSIYLPNNYIALNDKNSTVYYEVKGDGDKIILSGSTKITNASSNHKLVEPLIIIPSFRIDNEKSISINCHLENSTTTITHTSTSKEEKESVPLTTKITVFSLMFLFLIILKFIHEKWRIQN